MGEMTIRNIDEALMLTLTDIAARRGIDVEELAAALLKTALLDRKGRRAEGAMAILAAQSTYAARDSVELLREDRDRR